MTKGAFTAASGRSANVPGLLGDFSLLLILFVAFRLMLMMVHQPLLVDGVERGLSAGGDGQYYYQLASLSADGFWPFRDWWSEFPPVWPYFIAVLYQLQGENVNYSGWMMAMGILMLVCDVGNLILVRSIGTRLHGRTTGMVLAWIYAVMIAPVIFLLWTFETLVAFLLLLGLWLLLRKRDDRSALVAAVGALTKFTPALLFGAVIRFRPARAAARYVAIASAVFSGVYLVLFLQNAEMTAPSLTAQFGKASYQTVWALIDGNYITGNFGTVQSHFDPEAAGVLSGEPAVIPSFVRLALAGAVGLFVFVRTRRLDDHGLVAFVAITLLIFFLQAQGWSPQWLVQIIPLILLVFPTRNGVLVCVVLSMTVFFEYPVLFIRTGDTGGEVSGPLLMPFALAIIIRTVILVSLCVALYGKLRQEPVPEAVESQES